ncbi:MAG TPA: DUF4965 domain-containing protein [Terriglobales bacterium]|nr:DUF4965 domain-containing protein [Terriglobales bacterium]
MIKTKLACVLLMAASAAAAQNLRPPAVPLVTHDPYFSIWSMNDRLTDGPTRHWTGHRQQLTGLVRVDGHAYRWMGDTPAAVEPAQQFSLEVTPTRSTYQFDAGAVRLTVGFLSPVLPQDLELMSRPVTYLTLSAQSRDGASHAVQVLFDAAADLAVNDRTQQLTWAREHLETMEVLRSSDFQQPVLQKAGDDLRIDWGSFLVGVPSQPGVGTSVGWAGDDVEAAFAAGRPLPTADNLDIPTSSRGRPVLASVFDLGTVAASPVNRHVLLAYDDVYAIEYMQRRLQPYWRSSGPGKMLMQAELDYASIDSRAREFDQELTADLRRVGGDAYAQLAILAFRQTVAAHKLAADFDGTPMLFPKENFSNGCISTVDVLYPSSPFFLLFNPDLLKAQLRPVLDYASSTHWRFPFAPHDLGTYPLADGQVYGGGEKTEEDQMPVEESGNMLLMLAAMAHVDGNADFANHYWPLLQRWAAYLRDKGMDPENQLSTDDFAGHLAHNANLSIKAILALGGYAQLARMTGHTEEADNYFHLAEKMAKDWIPRAQDGDHYKLAFDKPGTWSQKYNLVWDRVLGLNLFPPAVANTEVAFYQKHLNAFGLPLDNRSLYTKLDWETWTATLAATPAQFEALIAPLGKFLNESPSRVPLTDWYWTDSGKQEGFQARSVVGGVYMPMLADPAMWKKWAGRAGSK